MSNKNNSNISLCDFLFCSLGFFLLLISLCEYTGNKKENTAENTQESTQETSIVSAKNIGKKSTSSSRLEINIIEVNGDFIIEIDKKTYNLDTLSSFLSKISDDDSGGKILLRCDGNVSVSFYHSVINRCQLSGITNISQSLKNI